MRFLLFTIFFIVVTMRGEKITNIPRTRLNINIKSNKKKAEKKTLVRIECQRLKKINRIIQKKKRKEENIENSKKRKILTLIEPKGEEK